MPKNIFSVLDTMGILKKYEIHFLGSNGFRV